MCEKHADKPAARMEARHVRALRDERSDQPGAANTRLKALKALFAWVCEEKPEIAPHNPTLGVRKIKYASDGHHSWMPEGIRSVPRRVWLLTCCSLRAAAVRMLSASVRNMREIATTLLRTARMD
jgi:integrase/recombinase XerD